MLLLAHVSSGAGFGLSRAPAEWALLVAGLLAVPVALAAITVAGRLWRSARFLHEADIWISAGVVSAIGLSSAGHALATAAVIGLLLLALWFQPRTRGLAVLTLVLQPLAVASGSAILLAFARAAGIAVSLPATRAFTARQESSGVPLIPLIFLGTIVQVACGR